MIYICIYIYVYISVAILAQVPIVAQAGRMDYGQWTSWSCQNCHTSNWHWRAECYGCGQCPESPEVAPCVSSIPVPKIAEIPGAPPQPAFPPPPDASKPPSPPGPPPSPNNPPPQLDVPSTVPLADSESGPLPHGNVWWLTLPETGPILCVADDGTAIAARLWSHAHYEMEWVLGGAEVKVDRFDKKCGYHCRIREALQKTCHAGTPFSLAWSFVEHAGNRFYACGLGSRQRTREQVAKASLAVTVQLYLGLSGTHDLDALLPLARQAMVTTIFDV